MGNKTKAILWKEGNRPSCTGLLKDSGGIPQSDKYEVSGSWEKLTEILDSNPGKYDLIVADVDTEDQNSLKNLLKPQWPPLIVCVDMGREDLAVQAIRDGAYDYVIKDPKGNFLKILPLTMDNAMRQEHINELRKREKEELAEALLKNKALMRALPDMIYIYSRNGESFYLKDDPEESQAFLPTELPGQDSQETALSNQSLEPVREAIAEVLDTDQMRSLEYELQTPTGPFRFEARIVPLDKDNVLTVVRDVTSEKRMRDEIERGKNLETIGILAAGVSHDFNNLLTGILGNLSLARVFASPDEKIFRLISEAEKTSLKAAELVQRLIAFSREEWLIRKEVPLFQVIKNAVRLFPKERMPQCDLNISEDVYPVYGDEEQLCQVFFSLLENAAESMAEPLPIIVTAENVSIDDSSRYSLERGNYVKVSVEDRGKGISEANLHQIFTPYFSTKKVRTPKGVGLGLAIGYAIIKQHRGNILVHSTVGKGSIFEIFLPAIVDGVFLLKKDDGIQKIKDRGRLLLMDDDPLVTEITGEMLEKVGFRVERCREGDSALIKYKDAMATGDPFSVVVLDIINKIGMAGKETLHRLKEIEPQVKSIAISGYLSELNPEELKKCGFMAILSKPYKIERLLKALDEVLDF